MELETGMTIAGTGAAMVLVKKIGDVAGWWAAPRQVVRMAKADAIAAKIRAESDIEVANLMQRAAVRSATEEITHQANIDSIILKALVHLADSASPGDMANDWVVNFFDKCRIVSDDEIQELWARLLAGEANSPGSFSRRAVNLMANLDTEQARLFETYCRFVVQIGGGYTPVIVLEEQRRLPAIYTENGLDYQALFELSDIGLVTLGFASSLPMTVQHRMVSMPESVTLTYGGKSTYLPCLSGYITTGFATLTPVGGQLASLCLPSTPIDGFFEFVCEHWEEMSLTSATLTSGSAARRYIGEGQ